MQLPLSIVRVQAIAAHGMACMLVVRMPHCKACALEWHLEWHLEWLHVVRPSQLHCLSLFTQILHMQSPSL